MERNLYLDKLIRRKNNGMIKVITGIRRSGKTYLLFELFYDYLIKSGVDKDHIIKIALDDRINKKYRDPDVLCEYVHNEVKDDDNELLIRGYNVDVGMVEFNYCNEDKKRAQKQLEVDFVCNQGSKRLYIQSALALPTKEKEEQEQLPLQNISDSFKKIIIVKDGPTHYNESGILILNLFDFLLKENSLEY